MDLILWRHAEAEEGEPDAARKLTQKGEKQAKKMAAWLKARVQKPVRMIVSPTVRTQQTARAFSSDVEPVKDVDPSSSAKRVLKATGWPTGEGTVIVVGHRPGLNLLASLLLSGQEVEWEIRKGAIWWFQTQDGDAEPVLRAVVTPRHV